MQEMQPMLYFKKERIMRKKTLALFLTCVLAAGMLAGCGNKDSKDNNQVENSQGTESAKDDQAAADEVAKLIDAIYVHCLLYTSPSPRDRTRSRMPSSA